jgi:hypothetical protein
MNTTARRIATTVAGLALAGSAVAATGPAAHAGKPGSGSTPLPLSIGMGASLDVDAGTYSYATNVSVPLGSKSIKSITCTLDGISLPSCGAVDTTEKKQTSYWLVPIENEVGVVQHTFSVAATASNGATYAGAITFAGFDW